MLLTSGPVSRVEAMPGKRICQQPSLFFWLLGISLLWSWCVAFSAPVRAQESNLSSAGNTDDDPFTKVSPPAVQGKPVPVSKTPPTGLPPVKIDFPYDRWSVLFLSKKPSRKPTLLPQNSRLKTLYDLQLTGAGLGNGYLVGEFSAESSWYIQNGYLQPVEKSDSAIRIGAVEDFELQGIWNVEGLGGWYILLGWNKGHGYLLENVKFVSSGSPWHIAEVRGGVGIKKTMLQVCRYEWKGDQPLRLTVKNRQLSMQIGKKKLIEGHNLGNYGAGDLIVGTYQSRFDPKPLKIRSLRIRALSK